jgi:hypothetical protein
MSLQIDIVPRALACINRAAIRVVSGWRSTALAWCAASSTRHNQRQRCGDDAQKRAHFVSKRGRVPNMAGNRRLRRASASSFVEGAPFARIRTR